MTYRYVANVNFAGETADFGSFCSHRVRTHIHNIICLLRVLPSVLSVALLMGLQAASQLAAALSKTDSCGQFKLQSKKVQSATDRWGLLRNLARLNSKQCWPEMQQCCCSLRSVLHCHSSTFTEAARQKPETRLARHQ